MSGDLHHFGPQTGQPHRGDQSPSPPTLRRTPLAWLDGHALHAYPTPTPSSLLLQESDLRALRPRLPRAEPPCRRPRACRFPAHELLRPTYISNLSARSPVPTALAALTKFRGVGTKVANCVLLFAYEHLDAFPIDVWIERVLRERYFPHAPDAPLGQLQTVRPNLLWPLRRLRPAIPLSSRPHHDPPPPAAEKNPSRTPLPSAGSSAGKPVQGRDASPRRPSLPSWSCPSALIMPSNLRTTYYCYLHLDEPSPNRLSSRASGTSRRTFHLRGDPGANPT